MRTTGKPGRKSRNEKPAGTELAGTKPAGTKRIPEIGGEKNGDGTKAILEGDNGAFGGGFYLLHVFDLF